MKKALSLLLSSSLLLGLAACGGSAAPQETGTPSPSAPAASGSNTADPSQVRIGILIPGSPTDGGFCQQAPRPVKPSAPWVMR